MNVNIQIFFLNFYLIFRFIPLTILMIIHIIEMWNE